MMDKTIVTRKEMYDLVWSTPMLTLSKKYQISDTGLRKICKRMGIPLPKAGHWQKIRYGKRVKKLALPENNPGEPEINLSNRQAADGDAGEPQSPFTKLRKEIAPDPMLSLIVPDRLTPPDELILDAKTAMEEWRRSEYYRSPDLLDASREGLDIRVSFQNVGRALRFMDTLIKGLRARGHQIRIRNHTFAVVLEEEIRIAFRERTRKVLVNDNNWSRSEFHPTGILAFQIEAYPRSEWKDGTRPLEDRLPDIIAKLELNGKERHENTLRHERNRRLRQEEERIQTERLERKKKELTDFKALLHQATRWRQTCMMREYLAAFEKNLRSSGGPSPDTQTWLVWAKAKIDWYDPMLATEDESLREVD